MRASPGIPNNFVGASVAIGLGGEIYVAYFDDTNGNMALSVDPDGIFPEGFPLFSTLTMINDAPGMVFTMPMWPCTLGVAPNGDVYAVWTDMRDMGITGADIRIAKSTDSGVTFGPSVRVSDTAVNNIEFWPSIAFTKSGDIWVSWTDDRDGTFDVFVSQSIDGGSTWSPNIKVNDDPTNEQALSRIAVNSLGVLYVIWYDNRALPETVYMDFTRDNGATWAGNFILPQTGYPSALADIAIDSKDIIHVAWWDISLNGIFYSRSLDFGASFTPDYRMDNGRDQVGPSLPRIAVDNAGYVTVTWMDDIGSPIVRYVSSWDWGTWWSGENSISARGEMSNVAYDQDRTLFFAYTEDEGLPNNYEAYVMWYNNPPRPVSNLRATELPTPGSVRLEWDPNIERDLSVYQVYKMGASTWSAELVAILPSSQTAYILNGLANGEYVYAVTAVDREGQQSDWRDVKFTVGPTVEDMILDLQNNITNLGNQIFNLQTLITNLGNQITSLQNQLTNLDSRISNMENNITNLGNQITNIQNQLTNLENQMTNMQNNITNLGNQLTNLQNQITNLENQMNNMQGDITNIQNQIANLVNQYTSLQNNITTMQGQMTTLQSQITTLQNQITNVENNLQTSIDDLQGDVDDVKDQNDGLKSQLDQLATIKNDLASAQNMNMILFIVLMVLVVITLLMTLRKPKMPAPAPQPPAQSQAPPTSDYSMPPPPQSPDEPPQPPQ